MSRLLTVLGAQLRPVSGDPERTFARFADTVELVAREMPHVDLLVFPEVFLTAEDPFAGQPFDPTDVAEPIPGPLTERIGKVAADAGRWIVAGSILERAGERVHNTALAVSPTGDLVARYRKLFPWEPFERTDPGDQAPPVFDVPGVGRIGLMICYDGWFPEVSRGLALAGAEVIVQPTLTSTPDREEETVLARANAIANQLYVVNVNAATSVGGGRSVGVDPEGRILFELGQNEELVIEVLDLDRVATVRRLGTRGLNRVWEHLGTAPRAVFEPYRRFLDG